MTSEVELQVMGKLTQEEFVSDLETFIPQLEKGPLLIGGEEGRQSFVVLSPELYEKLIEAVEDLEDIQTIQERAEEESVPVSLEGLAKQ